MPSGYTSDIYNGKDITFKDFALRCARDFGACMHQRDENYDIKPKLREKDSNDSYHIEKINEAKKWVKPTKAEFDAYVVEKTAYYNNQIDKQNKLKARYENILEQAKKWTPPTSEHKRLKEFMIEQLTQSMNFDCASDFNEQNLIEIKNLTYKKHIKDLQASNKRAIKYHTEQLEREDDNIDKANKWITDLYNSL
jgi:hypothetical protein